MQILLGWFLGVYENVKNRVKYEIYTRKKDKEFNRRVYSVWVLNE